MRGYVAMQWLASEGLLVEWCDRTARYWNNEDWYRIEGCDFPHTFHNYSLPKWHQIKNDYIIFWDNVKK